MVELTEGTFYGDAASFAIADALLSEVHHPEPRTMPEHAHAVPHFCLLLSGAYEESARGEKIEFTPQTIVYRPAHASHWDTVGAGGALFFIIERVPRASTGAFAAARSGEDVAASCGFADQSHLTRVFGAHTGTTPARYRKRLRTR